MCRTLESAPLRQVDHEHEALTMSGWPAPLPHITVLPTPVFACVSETWTYSETWAVPATGEDPQECLPRHSWMGKRGCSCPAPMEGEDRSPQSKKVPQPKRLFTLSPKGTRPVLAPLLVL